MPSHNAKKSGPVRNQNDSGNTKKKEIKPPAEGRKSVLDEHPPAVFRGFFQNPAPNDESEVAQGTSSLEQQPKGSEGHRNSSTSTNEIIGLAIARSRIEMIIAEKKRAEAKGKVNAVTENDSEFEMVGKDDAHDEDDEDEDMVVVVKEDDIEATANEDDYVEV